MKFRRSLLNPTSRFGLMVDGGWFKASELRLELTLV